MIHFVGAGCGAPDLITLRGKALIEHADVIIYAGSLVNPELLTWKKESCAVHDSAGMTLEEVMETILASEKKGLDTVRLHTVTDTGVYVVTLPRALAGALSVLSRSIQLFTVE